MRKGSLQHKYIDNITH